MCTTSESILWDFRDEIGYCICMRSYNVVATEVCNKFNILLIEMV